MENQAVTWASEAARKKDIRYRKISKFKSNLKMIWLGVYWRALHVTRLARPYSKLMCRLNLYRKSLDGRCQWCGRKH